MKIELSEMEQRMLALLEEAGEEDSRILMNEIGLLNGDRNECRQYRIALEGLISKGLAYLGLTRFAPVRHEELTCEQSAALAASAESWFRFDRQKGLWLYAEEHSSKSVNPNVLATDEGYALSQEILDRRGYNWWREEE